MFAQCGDPGALPLAILLCTFGALTRRAARGDFEMRAGRPTVPGEEAGKLAWRRIVKAGESLLARKF
ncbi:MAG: hypothetical protein H7Z16_08170 [Pyrinomonadaceae bacterium]|nr:hypothetical protein [Pyrinomonadaceae bacterium]